MKNSNNKIVPESKYITLKQAAEISGYSSDYIGQLIRQGKIDGKQIYFNVAWVTTEEEIHKYLGLKNQGKNPSSWRGVYLRFKHQISDWLFGFSPTLIVKSFFYSFVFLLLVIGSLLFILNINSDEQIKLSSPDIRRVVEYDQNNKKIIQITDLPYVP